MKIKNPSKITASIIKYLLMTAILLFLLFPIYWMLITAFKTNMEAYKFPPTFWPENFTLDSIINLFTVNNHFFIYYKNNFIVSSFVAVITSFISIFAGYALSRFKFNLNKWLFAAFLFSQMFPIISRMISLYDLMSKINLINTTTGLVFAIVAAQVPFTTLLMASFFGGLPEEIEEAAFIDGAGRFQVLNKIAIPLVAPGILASAIYAFIGSWDDYLHAVTLIQNDSLRTLSVGIALRYLGELSYDWSLINAISIIGTLPMVFIFFFFQKYMVKGLVAGALKG